MKNLLFFLFVILFLSLSSMVIAQSPVKFKYQAVARSADGSLITGEIGLRISFLENGPEGLKRYTETHQVNTSPQGVFDMEIGDGELVNGDLEEVHWGEHEYWLEVEMKIPGDNDYTKMGTTQLLSVPYAMYARTSGDAFTVGQGLEINNSVISNTGDLDATNELQSLELNGNQLFISNGNSVELPAGTNYTEGQGIDIVNDVIHAEDASATNEIQMLSLNGTHLTISDGNTVNLPTGPTYTEGQGISIINNAIHAEDDSPENEIQSLNINGTQLSISNGNSVTLPTGPTYTEGQGISIVNNVIHAEDDSPENEIQSLNINGTQLSISDGNAVTLPTYTEGEGIDIINNVIHAADDSPANEMQTLNVNGDQLSISNGNTVTLPTGPTYMEGQGINIINDVIHAEDISPTNEMQSLSINGNQLSITDGNAVNLPTYTAGAGIEISNQVISATDESETNEIQQISLNGQELSLSNGGGTVTLPASTSNWTQGNYIVYPNPANYNVGIGTDYSSGAKLGIKAFGLEDGISIITNGAGDALKATSTTNGNAIVGKTKYGIAGHFTSEEGVGGYFYSANDYALVANGKVGVKVTVPAYDLDVKGITHLKNDNGNALIVEQGNVGIGTSLPSHKLHIIATGTDAIYASSNAVPVTAAATGGLPAARLLGQDGVGCFTSSVSDYALHIDQSTYGTSGATRGILLQKDAENWKIYIDEFKDYNFAFNNNLKAWITDTDGSYHNLSDRRLKKNITTISNVLPKLTQLQAYNYHMKTVADDSPISVGFMAQEVEAIFPELVVEKEGYKSICYDHFAVLSVEAIKEQQKEIDSLKAEIDTLKALVQQLAEKK